MFNIVLLEPEIPANTGNIGRTCLVTGSRLHIIEPCGFILNDKNLKRAGMDYWKDLDVVVYDCLKDFLVAVRNDVYLPEGILGAAGLKPEPETGTEQRPATDSDENLMQNCSKSTLREAEKNISQSGSAAGKHRLWMATTKAQQTYADASFGDGDYIMFGKESAGIPEEMLLAHKEGCIRIPMASEQRSLNLSNSAAIILYEALRQNTFSNLELAGQLHNHRW